VLAVRIQLISFISKYMCCVEDLARLSAWPQSVIYRTSLFHTVSLLSPDLSGWLPYPYWHSCQVNWTLTPLSYFPVGGGEAHMSSRVVLIIVLQIWWQLKHVIINSTMSYLIKIFSAVPKLLHMDRQTWQSSFFLCSSLSFTFQVFPCMINFWMYNFNIL
jgi:hypothetical protein